MVVINRTKELKTKLQGEQLDWGYMYREKGDEGGERKS